MMSDAVAVAVIGLCGSGMGSLIGALVSNKVWQYRIEQLEKKVRFLGVCIDELGPSDRGIIDVSDPQTARFRPYAS